MISYARPDHLGSRFSDYQISPDDDPEALTPVLARILSVKAVVEKRRALSLRRYQVRLDLVTSLGAFVEMEALLPGNGQTPDDCAKNEAAATAEHREVFALLELDGLISVAGSYCDLITDASTWLSKEA